MFSSPQLLLYDLARVTPPFTRVTPTKISVLAGLILRAKPKSQRRGNQKKYGEHYLSFSKGKNTCLQYWQ